MSSFECCVVLVVDDEPTVLKTVTYALKRHGYIVIPASDGLTSAMRLYRAGTPCPFSIARHHNAGITATPRGA